MHSSLCLSVFIHKYMRSGTVDYQRLDMPGILSDRVDNLRYLKIHLEGKLELNVALRREFLWRPILWISRNIFA